MNQALITSTEAMGTPMIAAFRKQVTVLADERAWLLREARDKHD